MSGAPVPDAVPVLPVADLHRSLAFYERLGFDVRATYEGYAILGFGPTEVHLAQVPEVDGQETWTGAYLRVADADALFASWRIMGAPVIAEPVDQPYGIREFATEDPDGNLWRVGSPLGGGVSAADDLVSEEPVVEEPVVEHGGLAEVALAVEAEVQAEVAADAEVGDEPVDGRPGTGIEAWLPLVAGEGRCAGCGLVPGELPARALGAQVRDEVHAFGEVLAGADDDHVRRRPAPDVWSALEYGVHVRDVLNVYAERIVRTLAEVDPELGWWDHEAAIADGMANESDVSAVVDDLGRNASKLSESLRLVTEEDWGRRATRRPGEHVTIELLARFALHEVVHHRADAQGALDATA